MNTEKQLPRLFAGDDLNSICGNQEGFEELLEKISELLSTENKGCIDLSTNFMDEDIKTIILLNSDLIEPPQEDTSWTKLAILIFLFILSSFIVGAIQIISWIASLIS